MGGALSPFTSFNVGDEAAAAFPFFLGAFFPPPGAGFPKPPAIEIDTARLWLEPRSWGMALGGRKASVIASVSSMRRTEEACDAKLHAPTMIPTWARFAKWGLRTIFVRFHVVTEPFQTLLVLQIPCRLQSRSTFVVLVFAGGFLQAQFVHP